MEISNQPAIKKTKRLTSIVWNDFERVKRGDAMVAICKHCTKKLTGSSTSGTSHLRNHLKRCLKRSNCEIPQPLLVVREKKKDETIDFGNFKFSQEQGPRDLRFNQEQSRFDLARMIILHEYPLAMVEHLGFKRFVQNLQPSFRIMPSNSAEADCIQIYKKQKQKVYEMLDKVPGRISLTADTWTSFQDNRYLCLTAHYIDEAWLLRKKILNFIMVDPHTEQALSEAIITSLLEWDIDHKLFSITLDNYSINDNAVFRIRDRLSQNRLLLSNGQLFHVRCAIHIVNLIVQDILEALCEVTHKIRESVRYAKSSETMQQKFNEIVHQVQINNLKSLCLDFPSQWNSTYLMLEAAIGYRDAFFHLQKCDSGYTMALSDIEWERASVINNYLKLFVEVTNVLSGTKYPTSNLYFPEICDVHLQLMGWCNSSDTFTGPVALKMKSKFDTYWNTCSLNLAIAAILDPRFKMKLVEYYYPQIYGCDAADCIKDVSNGIKGLYNEYASCSTLVSVDQGSACGGNSSSSGINGVNNDTKDRLRGFDEFLHETSNCPHMNSELDKYLEEPVFPRNMDFDILNWWKINSPKYPTLSMMARDVLGMPMSVPTTSGSAFETGGRVLDLYRSSLGSDVLQALICTHDWLRTELEDHDSATGHSPVPLCVTGN